jgi:glycosyltransferase involved in cell wall biosynthesis
MIFLTIIIPHHNDLVRLERLIQSIPKNEEIETIVVDDHSPDRACVRNVVEKYSGIVFLENWGPQGAGMARNAGLQEARGKWVVFSDSDDTFVEEAFCVAIRALEHCEYKDIVFFLLDSFDEGTGAPSSRHLFYNNLVHRYVKCGDEDSIRLDWNSPCGKFYRHDFLVRNNILFSSHMAGNDVLFSVNAGILARKIGAIEKVAYRISDRQGSLTKGLDARKALDRLDVLVKKNEILLKNKAGRKADVGFTYLLWSITWTGAIKNRRLYLRYMRCLCRVIFHKWCRIEKANRRLWPG